MREEGRDDVDIGQRQVLLLGKNQCKIEPYGPKQANWPNAGADQVDEAANEYLQAALAAIELN